MLAARKALGGLCDKHSLEFAELARHSAALGLDVQSIDDHARHIQQVLYIKPDFHPILPLIICVNCACTRQCWDLSV